MGEAGNLECGSLIRIELRVQAGVIVDARYQAHGCPATLASASEVCARVRGVRLLEAAGLAESDVCRSLGLRPGKEYTAEIALDALHGALGSVLGAFPRVDLGVTESASGERGVLVGMSGGVDSGVAAMLLVKAGFRVVGITLRLWNDPGVSGERSCCSPESVRRARAVAHGLGIPHLTLDASALFQERVVQYFVQEYAEGRTPNPCAKCNARVRLGLMLDVAHRLGLPRVATGHYARLTGSPPCLTRGVDTKKDQSYVLAEVSPDLLEQMLFPLGEMTKIEVRRAAAAAGLEGHSAAESQEICFVPDDDHRRFLRARLGEAPGEIVDGTGRVVGRHSGTYNFTPGQRRGLRVAGPQPLYVLRVDAGRRLVVVGSLAETAVGAVHVEDLTFHRPSPGGDLSVQLRSSSPAVPVRSVELAGGRAVIALGEAAYGVAPGQTAVLYSGTQVAMAGTIAGTET